MTHRFPIKEIARQSGLGVATIDRVLNDRRYVSAITRNRVLGAIEELKGQERQISARGRRLFVDIVVEAPQRFSQEIRKAAEEIAPMLMPVVIRPRFHFAELIEPDKTIATLQRIAKRGSDGICLKARDLPQIRKAIAKLGKLNIPVVTIFTDIANSDAIGYAGLDHQGAGRVAAYLVWQRLKSKKGSVLVTQSQVDFQGELMRGQEFAKRLQSLGANLKLIDASGGAGLDQDTAQMVKRSLKNVDDLCAVYSPGGGNRAIVSCLAELGQSVDIYIAHDLDRDNRALLGGGQIDFVLRDNLAQDLRAAFGMLAHYHGLAKRGSRRALTQVEIIIQEHLA